MKPVIAPAILVGALFVGLGASNAATPRASQHQEPLIYLGKSATTVIMASGLGPLDTNNQRTIWVWHFFGPAHAASTPDALYGQAVHMTVDCSNRRTINRAIEHISGSTVTSRMNLYVDWTRPPENTLGALPVRAVCDPAPATPRPTYPDAATARAHATLRLKPIS